jgi:hypothetical protein
MLPSTQPSSFQIPGWFSGAHPDSSGQDLYGLYTGWLGRHPDAPGNQLLAGGDQPPGPPAGGGASPPPPPPASPSPGGPGAGAGLTPPPGSNPFAPGPQTAPGGFNPFLPYQPPGMPPGGAGGYYQPGANLGQQGPGGMPQTFAYNDPFNQFLAGLPTMDLNMKRQISGAMSSAGMSGNRFGSWAGQQAGQIGGQAALQENQAFLDAMKQRADTATGQALQAAGLGTGAGTAMNQALQGNLGLASSIGQAEQQRQDQFANLRYQDFNQNKLGWFPYLLQAAMSRQAGYPGPVMYNSTGGKPGALDWIGSLLPGLVGISGAGGLGSVLGGLFGQGSGGGGGTNPITNTPILGPSGSPGAPTDPGVGG